MDPPASHTPIAETLIPHRGRMLLVDEIVHLDDDQATVRSVASERWPLCAGETVNPLIMIELIAQTAGIHNGLRRLKTRGAGGETRGWLVGIKKARFHVAGIAVGAAVTTTTRTTLAFEGLREITGTATIHGQPAADVVLQVVEAEPETAAP